jgi:hypothetical protein
VSLGRPLGQFRCAVLLSSRMFGEDPEELEEVTGAMLREVKVRNFRTSVPPMKLNKAEWRSICKLTPISTVTVALVLSRATTVSGPSLSVLSPPLAGSRAFPLLHIAAEFTPSKVFGTLAEVSRELAVADKAVSDEAAPGAGRSGVAPAVTVDADGRRPAAVGALGQFQHE